MDISYEKKWPNEKTSSAAVLIDEPIHVQQAPVRIRHYFVFSLFSALCLCPLTGLIALAYSLKSSAKADVKFHDKARLYSRRALFWNLASVVFAVISCIVTLILCYQLNDMMMSNYGNRMYQPRRSDDIDKLIKSITNN